MPDMIMRDVRVNGPRPKGSLDLEVAGNTPRSWLLLWVASEAGSEGDSLLKIFAHGLAPASFLAGNYGKLIAVYSQGGGGLKFCQPSEFPHSQRIDDGIDIQKRKRNRFIRARFNARDS